LIVDLDVALASIGQVLSGVEASGDRDRGDAPVEAFDYAVNSGRVLGIIRRCSRCVPNLGAGRLALARGAEAVGKLFAVISEDLSNGGQHRVDQVLEETAR